MSVRVWRCPVHADRWVGLKEVPEFWTLAEFCGWRLTGGGLCIERLVLQSSAVWHPGDSSETDEQRNG